MTQTVFRFSLAGVVLALGLSAADAQDKDKDKPKDKPNPAAKAVPSFNMGRHKTFLKRIADSKGEGDVIFLGDSITQGWEGQKKTWDKHFGAFKPVNLGISGEQTTHVLWRITEGKELADLKPKVAVIMIGTNNLGARHTAEQIAGGIKAIVEELRKQKPEIKVLVLGVFPRASAPKDTKVAPAASLNKTIPAINEIISKLDDGKNVFYKDIGGKFLDDTGGLPRATMPDLLHLSPKGYEVWGEAIKADIEKLLK